MSELKEKILKVIQSYPDAGWSSYVLDELAEDIIAIISAISEEPDLPITPGEWYSAFNLDKEEVVAVHSRGVTYTICVVNTKISEWKQNKKAITTLPKVFATAQDVCSYGNEYHGGMQPSSEPYGLLIDLEYIRALKTALEEAGVEV